MSEDNEQVTAITRADFLRVLAEELTLLNEKVEEREQEPLFPGVPEILGDCATYIENLDALFGQLEASLKNAE